MIAHQAQHSISIMARVLALSKSGYYAWLRREPSRRVKANNALQRDIARIHETSRGTYGSPRVLASLRREGLAVSRKRVARQMAAMGLKGVSRRRFITTTRRGQGRPAPDLVQRRFEADAPDKLWVADITYVPTRRDWLFLAVVIDVFIVRRPAEGRRLGHGHTYAHGAGCCGARHGSQPSAARRGHSPL